MVKQHDERRTEILDTARALFYRKGYDHTSIQDIIDTVGIAKGTFYHYFGSKVDLLDDLIKRMLQEAIQLIEPIVADGELNALEKFNCCFSEALAWKMENKAFLLGILSAFYSDENALFRQKLKEATVEGIAPLLTRIIRQGIAEGIFHADYPDEVVEIVLVVGQWLSDTVGQMVLLANEQSDPLPLIERWVAVVHQATERMLGAPPGSLQMIDLDMLREWFE
ncbi:MAG: TetR/AcrR family transcriptional regulator [Anaerolineae bacterium]